MTAPVRKAIHAYLSNDAYEAWHRFARTHGVSLGAVLTALAAALHNAQDLTTAEMIDAVIANAQDADRDKRRARRKAIAQRTVTKAEEAQ